jgi:thiosulfate reductase cytochrome b subunit
MKPAPKHPLAIRWLHWINFPVMLLMLWSGILILWAYDYYPTPDWRLKVPDRVSFYLWGIAPVYGGADDPAGLPQSKYVVTLGYRLAEGMAWHFALAWFFVLNGMAYAIYLALSGQWRHLLPRRDSLKKAMKVALADLKFWQRPELAEGGEKYNHAQRIAYSGVVLLGLGLCVTGIAISKPAQLSLLVRLLGGYQAARLEHFICTALVVLFVLVHVAQVVRAGWRNFRGMIVGR